MGSRVLVEPLPCSGSWNMAVDEVLLEASAVSGSSALRIYEWDAATVSLGYFQSAEDPSLESRFPGLAKVRRLSGGGAILHHHEVTYSITIADGHPLSVSPGVLYEEVHRRVIGLLAAWGIEVNLRGEAIKFAAEPFLCFSRGDARDIVIGRHKVMGSAQRRRRGAVLQHGSLLLSRSDFAPEFPGLVELAGLTRQRREVALALADALVSLLPGDPIEAGLTELEHLQAEELTRSRYANLSR
ncbi:MAG: lipoate--protein ligase family protein [Planctomycetota bacterium]|jgi:lipoate-protein ligase A|nr:MAG: lipoate--protein ligase family protein [Planctomycetota bacterium]